MPGPFSNLAAVFSALALALSLVIVPGCDSGSGSGAGTGRGASVMDSVKAPETRAIPFTVKTFDGGEFVLKAAPGRVTVVNFWASWCGPCKFEAPVLARAYEEYGPRGVAFVGVAIQDTVEGSERFIEEYGLKFPNGPDDTGTIMRDYKVFGIPKTYVITPDGVVAYSHTGAVNSRGLSEAIEGLL